jgi:hypothetical protein
MRLREMLQQGGEEQSESVLDTFRIAQGQRHPVWTQQRVARGHHKVATALHCNHDAVFRSDVMPGRTKSL